MSDVPAPDDDVPEGALDQREADERLADREFVVRMQKALSALGEPAERMDVDRFVVALGRARRRLGLSCFFDDVLDPVTPQAVERFAFDIAVLAFAAGRAAAARRAAQGSQQRAEQDKRILETLQATEARHRKLHPARLKKTQVNSEVARALRISEARVRQARKAAGV